MSCESSYQPSVYSNTEASNTPGFDTPSASDTMSTTFAITADLLQTSSPAYENIFRSFQDTFTNLRVEMARLEIENKRLVEHNTSIEKELEALNELNTAIEKELATLNEENVKISESRNDAVKKLAEVEEENASLKKELGGLGELREILGWKKRCEELENRVTESHARMQNLVVKNQERTHKLCAENQERIEKVFEDYQKKMEKRIADVQHQGQQNLEQEIARIKADHIREMQSLISPMGLMALEDWEDNYIFREKPFEIIPNGMIQVSRTKARECVDFASDTPPCEDDQTCFLYVVRDQYKDFKKFANLAELVFGLKTNHIAFLMGTKSGLMYYGNEKAKVIRKWENEASQQDRIYITSYLNFSLGAIHYIED
ncbi:hypothetical protein BZA77DRAFT_30827 [Pyronema omphalodes]|nr:hypothetical protein BZA77DRAFT_30827 [Pyronema omphalodes]